MAFKLNPLTGELDLVSKSVDIYLGSEKLEYYLNALASFDRVSEINYLDLGLRNQRVNTIIYTSVDYPSSNVTKSVSYLGNGTMDRRISTVEWSGSVFGSDILRKTFEYDLVGFKHIVSGYYFEIV